MNPRHPEPWLNRRRFLAATVVHAVGSPAAAESQGEGAFQPLDDLLARFLVQHAVPGASLAVTRQGKLVYARGFGFADSCKRLPVTPQSRFRIASISKPITAVAILQLVDAGRLQLDDPVLKHFQLEPFLQPTARLDARWAWVTVRHCLQHTGGWDRDRRGGFDPIGIPARIARQMRLAHAPTPDNIVQYMLGQPLDFDPGTQFAYSNLGYLVLGRIIEAIMGQAYEAWVRKNVLAPVNAESMRLGMGLPEQRFPDEVAYYDSQKRLGRCLYPSRVGQQVPLPDGALNIEAYEAHGGWVATATDLVRFASAFDVPARSPLLSAAAIEQMWARPTGLAGFDSGEKPKPVYYGCGWDVRPLRQAGRLNTWHTGLIPGTSALLVRRWDGFNWAVLFNTDASTNGDILSTRIDGPLHGAIDAVPW